MHHIGGVGVQPRPSFFAPVVKGSRQEAAGIKPMKNVSIRKMAKNLTLALLVCPVHVLPIAYCLLPNP